MYYFEQDLVDRALKHYTYMWCGGPDQEFYLETWYRCYGDPALEACIVMDYIDEICRPVYEEVCESFSEHVGYKHQGSLDGKHGSAVDR